MRKKTIYKLIILGVAFLYLLGYRDLQAFTDCIREYSTEVRKRCYGDWSSESGDVRQNILLERSIYEVTAKNGIIKYGGWIDFYTGQIITSSSQIDIDHVVSVSEFHGLIGRTLSRDQMQSFHDDPQNLVITDKSINRSKSNNSPCNWLPPNLSSVIGYLAIRREVLLKYGAEIPPKEDRLYKRLLMTRLSNGITAKERADLLCDTMN